MAEIPLPSLREPFLSAFLRMKDIQLRDYARHLTEILGEDQATITNQVDKLSGHYNKVFDDLACFCYQSLGNGREKRVNIESQEDLDFAKKLDEAMVRLRVKLTEVPREPWREDLNKMHWALENVVMAGENNLMKDTKTL